MKRDDLQDYIIQKHLLDDIQPAAGIYMILVNDYVAYIGQSTNIYRRASEHIYNIENGYFSKENKYRLLLAAELGGYQIKYEPLEYCDVDILDERENLWIDRIMPPLNAITPQGKQEVNSLTIFSLIKSLLNGYMYHKEANVLFYCGEDNDHTDILP